MSSSSSSSCIVGMIAIRMTSVVDFDSDDSRGSGRRTSGIGCGDALKEVHRSFASLRMTMLLAQGDSASEGHAAAFSPDVCTSRIISHTDARKRSGEE